MGLRNIYQYLAFQISGIYNILSINTIQILSTPKDVKSCNTYSKVERFAKENSIIGSRAICINRELLSGGTMRTLVKSPITISKSTKGRFPAAPLNLGNNGFCNFEIE